MADPGDYTQQAALDAALTEVTAETITAQLDHHPDPNEAEYWRWLIAAARWRPQQSMRQIGAARPHRPTGGGFTGPCSAPQISMDLTTMGAVLGIVGTAAYVQAEVVRLKVPHGEQRYDPDENAGQAPRGRRASRSASATGTFNFDDMKLLADDEQWVIYASISGDHQQEIRARWAARARGNTPGQVTALFKHAATKLRLTGTFGAVGELLIKAGLTDPGVYNTAQRALEGALTTPADVAATANALTDRYHKYLISAALEGGKPLPRATISAKIPTDLPRRSVSRVEDDYITLAVAIGLPDITGGAVSIIKQLRTLPGLNNPGLYPR